MRQLEAQLKDLQVQQQPSPESHLKDELPNIKANQTVPLKQFDLSTRQEKYGEIPDRDFVTREIKPKSTQTYGYSSTFYFISQLASYLDAAFQQNSPDSAADSPSNNHSVTAEELQGALSVKNADSTERSIVQETLSRSDEEELLDIYWSTWHILYPILDKDEITEYYKNLWKSSEVSRDFSAIVDIILALGMQLKAAISASYSVPSAPVPPTDSTAGWWYYRRCQYILQDDLEVPSFTTFQCQYLAVCWLSRASWHNTAHNVLAAALRIGVSLGLHHEPSLDLPPAQRHARKLMWWTMYAVDAQYALELGRPLGVHFGQVSCTLPEDDLKSTCASSPTLSPSSFNIQLIKLILASRAIYSMFYRVCLQFLHQSGQSDLFRDPTSLETCAKWLETNISYLTAWSEQVIASIKYPVYNFDLFRKVPEGLTTPRENLGQPYSTDRSRLELHKGDKLSRGLLVLEMLYHQFSMCLYRHFICLSHGGTGTTATVERHAVSCVNHAITMIQIAHQDITEGDSLRTWSIVCTWQWHAALSIVGYILAYPRGPVTPTGRKALSIAIASFELLSGTFTNTISCVHVLRNLVEKVDILLGDAQLSIAANQMEHSLLSTSINASILDYENLPMLYDEWNKQVVPDVISNWTNPEFDLREFTRSEISGISANWGFDPPNPGSASRY